jgi:hypothetical protein
MSHESHRMSGFVGFPSTFRWIFTFVMSVLLDAGPDVEAIVRAAGGDWLKFGRPFRVIRTDEVTNVVSVIDSIERSARTDGVWAVGFVTYEAGAAFGLRVHNSIDGLPLVWFALFDAPPTRLRHLSEWCRSGARDVSEQASDA